MKTQNRAARTDGKTSKKTFAPIEFEVRVNGKLTGAYEVTEGLSSALLEISSLAGTPVEYLFGEAIGILVERMAKRLYRGYDTEAEALAALQTANRWCPPPRRNCDDGMAFQRVVRKQRGRGVPPFVMTIEHVPAKAAA